MAAKKTGTRAVPLQGGQRTIRGLTLGVEMFFEDDEEEVGAGGGAVAGVGVGEGAGFVGAAVAAAFVPGDQGLADLDYRHFDRLGAVGGGVLFGGGEEFAAEAAVLLRGADGQGAEVPLVRGGGLEADAALESGCCVVGGEEIESAFGDFFGEKGDVCAFAGDVFAFDAPSFGAAEGDVHECGDGGEVGGGCGAERYGHFFILGQGRMVWRRMLNSGFVWI